MHNRNARLIGIELYFDDLQAGKRFYSDTRHFPVLDEHPGQYTRFDAKPAFICLERKGSESYPSRDKAVIFLEVPPSPRGRRICRSPPHPRDEARKRRQPPSLGRSSRSDGYNIILLEAAKENADTTA